MKEQAAMDYALHCAKYNSSIFVVWILDPSFFPCFYYHTYQGSKARFNCDTTVENCIFYFFVPDSVFVIRIILKYKLGYMFQCVNSISHFFKTIIVLNTHQLFWIFVSVSSMIFYFLWNIVTKHLPKAQSSWFWSEILGQILTFHNIFSFFDLFLVDIFHENCKFTQKP